MSNVRYIDGTKIVYPKKKLYPTKDGKKRFIIKSPMVCVKLGKKAQRANGFMTHIASLPDGGIIHRQFKNGKDAEDYVRWWNDRHNAIMEEKYKVNLGLVPWNKRYEIAGGFGQLSKKHIGDLTDGSYLNSGLPICGGWDTGTGNEEIKSLAHVMEEFNWVCKKCKRVLLSRVRKEAIETADKELLKEVNKYYKEYGWK